MKKIIILCITTILLTGCNATYNINFTKNKIEDSIKIYTNNKNVQNATKEVTEKFSEQLGNWERGYEFYKREIYATDKITGYEYTYNFNYEEYDAMSQLRKCYKDFELNYEKDTITINTSKEFLCQIYYPEVNSLELNITSEYEILNSNADKKKNNTHTWNINKTNYKQKPINITISKVKKQQNNPQNKKNKLDIQAILTITIFILLIIVLIIRKKDQKQR